MWTFYHWHIMCTRHWPPACLQSWAEFNFARYVQDWTQSVLNGEKSREHTQFCQIWSNMKTSKTPTKYELNNACIQVCNSAVSTWVCTDWSCLHRSAMHACWPGCWFTHARMHLSRADNKSRASCSVGRLFFITGTSCIAWHVSPGRLTHGHGRCVWLQ